MYHTSCSHINYIHAERSLPTGTMGVAFVQAMDQYGSGIRGTGGKNVVLCLFCLLVSGHAVLKSCLSVSINHRVSFFPPGSRILLRQIRKDQSFFEFDHGVILAKGYVRYS